MPALKVALATCQELPHLDGDEAHLVRALEKRGVEHVIAAWDAGDAPFLDADLTVIRSTWDYTEKVDAFVAWVARVEQRSRIFNPASVVRWNTHKRYLAELAAEGIHVVPTHVVPAGARVALHELLAERGWTRGAVVKPCVSAGSKDTVRVTPGDEASLAEAQALLARESGRDMMVQPFVHGIERGELSLIHIDGALTHAVNKTPKSGDFRSQPEFGSRVERVEPSRAHREVAADILRTVGGQLLYARMDFVTGDDSQPWLMELELVEPSLYFAWAPEAAERLVDAILARGVPRGPR